MTWRFRLVIGVMTLAMAVSCQETDKQQEGTKPKKRSIPVSASAAVAKDLSITEEAIGLIESKSAPFISAEAPGQVVEMFVDVGQEVAEGQKMAQLDMDNLKLARDSAQAEANRISALIENQERTTGRLQKLVEENFVNQAMVDEAESHLKALKEQLASAKAQLARVESDLAKTAIVSPLRGRVEQRLADVGDFMSAGKPIFRIASSEFLRVVLPFPETIAAKFAPGLDVRLSSPASPGVVANGVINEIRPMISAGARAVEIILDVKNPGGWKPGGTVKGVVVLEVKPSAVMIRETCVVLRPAGAVAYVVDGAVARQKVVVPGVRKDGMVEIISGLSEGDMVVTEGASYLSDGTAVTIREE